MPLAPLSAGFQSLPLLPTSKLGPSGADSQVGRFVYVLGPVGLSNELSYDAGNFFHCHCNPPQVFTVRGFEALFPCPTLVPCLAWSVHSPVVLPDLSACKCGTAQSASHHLA